jgi:hypothetical protein
MPPQTIPQRPRPKPCGVRPGAYALEYTEYVLSTRPAPAHRPRLAVRRRRHHVQRLRRRRLPRRRRRRLPGGPARCVMRSTRPEEHPARICGSWAPALGHVCGPLPEHRSRVRAAAGAQVSCAGRCRSTGHVCGPLPEHRSRVRAAAGAQECMGSRALAAAHLKHKIGIPFMSIPFMSFM